MRYATFLGLVLAVAPALGADKAPVVPPRQGDSETITLFNGRDLQGWEGHPHLWSVQDGVIVQIDRLEKRRIRRADSRNGAVSAQGMQ